MKRKKNTHSYSRLYVAQFGMFTAEFWLAEKCGTGKVSPRYMLFHANDAYVIQEKGHFTYVGLELIIDTYSFFKHLKNHRRENFIREIWEKGIKTQHFLAH